MAEALKMTMARDVRTAFKAFASAVGFMLMNEMAVAQHVHNRTLNAAPGQTIRIGFYNDLDLTCHSIGEPTIRIISQPQHGRVQIQKSRATPNYDAANARNKCNQYVVPGVLVTYAAGKSGASPDAFVILVNWTSGASWTQNITVNVR